MSGRYFCWRGMFTFYCLFVLTYAYLFVLFINDDIIELTQFLSVRTEAAVQAGAAIDPRGKKRLAGEGATVMVLGDSVSTCVSAPVRRVVRRRDLRSVDLSGDAIELPRRRERKRLLWSVVPSLSQSKCTANIDFDCH